jgi:hypothetical protein
MMKCIYDIVIINVYVFSLLFFLNKNNKYFVKLLYLLLTIIDLILLYQMK